MGARQMLLYPACGLDKVERIAVVLFHARCHGEHIGVEYDVVRIDAGLLCQQFVGAAAHFDFTFIAGGLPHLVKSHNHHGGAILPDGAGMSKESFFALFQRYGVDHALALHTFQRSLNHGEARGVYHPGDTCHLGV